MQYNTHRCFYPVFRTIYKQKQNSFFGVIFPQIWDFFILFV